MNETIEYMVVEYRGDLVCLVKYDADHDSFGGGYVDSNPRVVRSLPITKDNREELMAQADQWNKKHRVPAILR